MPCECTGTCAYVHTECLEHWVLERGSSKCEVCKAPYKEQALTDLGRRRLEEQRRRELEWPQHEHDAEFIVIPPPTISLRRMVFVSSMLLFSVILFLAHDEDRQIPNYTSRLSMPDISDSQADTYLIELGLSSPRSETDPLNYGLGDGTSLPSSPSAPLPPVDSNVALRHVEEELIRLLVRDGCATTEGREEHSRSCEIADSALAHFHKQRQETRERYAEQEAGEAMGRLMRAFVLLCMLRIIIAQQQRRRLLMLHDRQWMAARDRPGLPV